MIDKDHPIYKAYQARQSNRATPLERLEAALGSYWGMGDNRAEMKRQMKLNQAPVGAFIDIFDELLAGEPDIDELLRLIQWVANHPLNAADKTHAEAWLRTERDWLMSISGDF